MEFDGGSMQRQIGARAVSANAVPATDRIARPATGPRYRLAASAEVAVTADADNAIADQFRRLRGMLSPAGAYPACTVTITSPVAGDGKSVVSLNLALAFANRGDRTVLVDAELRKRAEASLLAPVPDRGLTDVLAGRCALDDALLEVEDTHLSVLPAGPLVPDPTGLLGSDECVRMMAELKARFDHVVVDTPPVIPFADAAILGALCDGTIVVTRAGHTPRKLYDETLAALANVKVLGTVLNGAGRSLADLGRSPDGYYRQYYAQSSRAKKRK